MGTNNTGNLDLARRFAELRSVGAFLTILPMGRPDGGTEISHGPGELAAAAWCFPIIGLFVGAAGGLLYGLAIWLGCSVWLAATLCVALLVLLCGGLHEDGLGDFFDGLGGTNRDRRLAIMRDSQAGNFAVVALLLLFAGRIGAISALAAPERVIPALLVAAAVSRAAMVVVMHVLPAARSQGLGADAGRPGLKMAIISVLIAAVIAWVAMGFIAALASLAGAALAAALLAAVARNRLGGQTGDVLGAVQVTAEFGSLSAASLMF
ncbi:MAG: adenosylcobinamide-GDP ribazoletransferase [Alphaproteobacteria bacterium]|jgi:adenosylcobinamide-GDP ribazoletransferase|nr:adenosylcobinamide-GDP ribazoletransferase [Alphaproteobacteria bacterium]